MRSLFTKTSSLRRPLFDVRLQHVLHTSLPPWPGSPEIIEHMWRQAHRHWLTRLVAKRRASDRAHPSLVRTSVAGRMTTPPIDSSAMAIISSVHSGPSSGSTQLLGVAGFLAVISLPHRDAPAAGKSRCPNHANHAAVEPADCLKSRLRKIEPSVFEGQQRSGEHLDRVGEIEAAFEERLNALCRIELTLIYVRTERRLLRA